MPDLDQLLRPDISLAASRAVEPFDFTAIERRAQERGRNRAALAFCAAAVVGVLALVVSVQAGRPGSAPPTVPIKQPTASPTPGWTGPLRADAASLPKVSAPQVDVATGADRWTDGADAAAAAIDILDLSAGGSRRLEWRLRLGAWARDRAEGPNGRTFEWGLVVDTVGDRTPDCQISIEAVAPGASGFRVSVRNLRTGATAKNDVGGPYGYPIDFAYNDVEPGVPEFTFFFLGTRPGPCDPFKRSSAFYAFAVAREGGQPVAWDVAPDASWLRMPAKESQ